MRNQSTRAPGAKALAALLLLASALAAAADNDAAHRLAETFAGAHAGGAEEAAAKARARAQREEDVRRAAEAARRAFEAQRAARQRHADEADMLARARAEAAEEQAAQARGAEQARRAVEARREEEARDLAGRLRQARDADAERAILDAEAKADARRAEPLDESSIAQPGFAPAPEAAPDDQRPVPSSDPQDFVSAEPQWPAREPLRGPAETRTTVLLVLEPGSRGIRRWNKTADPMLCVGATCYVSTGAASPATALTRGRAFGPGVALGGRAGACRNALGCVFRGIPLEGRVAIQPIDLRLLRHDRREVREVVPDETCRLVRGALSCRAPVRAETYRAWIVPERLAERAGPEALAAAVESGLPDEVSGRD
jgi:hypothetical protein